MLPVISLLVQVGGGLSLARYGAHVKQLVDSIVPEPYMVGAAH